MQMRIVVGLIALGAALGVALVAAPAVPAAAARSLTWQPRQLVDPAHGGFTDVSCPSSTFCLAAGKHGSILKYTGGTTWSRLTTLGDTHTVVRAIDCTSQTFCVATTARYGNEEARWVFNGSTWKSSATFFSPEFDCVDRTFCLMTESFDVAERWNGQAWVRTAYLPHDLSDPYGSVSCAAATMCMQLATGGRAFRYDGADWSDATVIDSRELTAIDCQTTTFCVAGDTGGYVTTWNGTSWSSPTLVDPGHAIDSLDCSSAGFCAAGDDAGSVVEYRSGTWSAPKTVQAGVSLVATSCPTSAFCAAVTRVGSVVRRVGGSWQPAEFVNTAYGDVAAVSCASATLCLIADGSGALVRYDGTRWHQPARVVADGAALTDIACVGSGFCMAVTVDGRALVRSTSGTWSQPRPTGLTEADGVACTSVTFCLVTGFGPTNAAVWNGTAFVDRGSLPGQYVAHFRPTCARAADCFALPYEGTPMMRYHNGTWRHANGAGDSFSIDCAGPVFCMAMTFSGDSTEADPHNADAEHWTGSKFVASGSSLPLFNVSCGSSTFCVAAEAGYESTWNGTSWSARKILDTRSNFSRFGTPSIIDVDCRPAVCVALETTGDAIVAR